MVLILSALAFCSAPTITLTVKGAPVARVLEQIEERTGTSLLARDPILHQMLLIDVKDAEVEDLLQRIAEVTYGEWKEEKDTRVLFRPPALVQKLRQAEIDERAKTIEGVLQLALRKQRPWTPVLRRQLVTDILAAEARFRATNDDDQYKAAERLRRELPLPSALARVLWEVGAKTIAATDWNERVVYSNQPTAKQVRLPPKCEEILSEMRAQSVELNREFERQSGSVPNAYASPSERTRRVLVATTPYAAVLRFSGERVGGTNLRFDYEAELATGAPHYPPTPIRLGEEGRWVADWLRSRIGNRSPPVAEGPIRTVLLSPADQPKVGTLVFDVLKAMADHDRHQLVAWIPLASESRLERDLCIDPTLALAEATIARNQLSANRADGWLLITPRQPITAEWAERPREPMQRFVRRVEEIGAVRLLDVAELIHELRVPLVPRETAMLGYASGLFGVPLVELLGSLTGPQLEAAASPEGIALSQLAPSQRAVAEAEVYSQQEWGVAPFEVTDVFPTGLPGNGVFTVRVSQQEVVQPWSRTTNPLGAPELEAAGLAGHLAALGQPETEWSGPWAKIDRFRYSTRSVFTLKLDFGPLGSMQSEARESALFKGEGVPFEELPASFRKKVPWQRPPPSARAGPVPSRRKMAGSQDRTPRAAQ